MLMNKGWIMNIYGVSEKELSEILIQNGFKGSSAAVIFKQIYHADKTSFCDIKGISKQAIQFLENTFTFEIPKLLELKENDTAAKIVFELDDGNVVETVLMKHQYGNGLCVSTQVGCNMACDFCESGKVKRIRNLLTHEMTGQVLGVKKALNTEIKHISIMGIGEPFDNYDNVKEFIEILNNNNALSFGKRHITVSTCGLVPRIFDYVNDNIQANLAVSLHASNDTIRNRIMPINKAYPISELMKAIGVYNKEIGRKITFEYVLLEGINDSDTSAIELAHLLNDINCYVNLIQYNETESSKYHKSSFERLMSFYSILKQKGVHVTIRREFGSDINAACGQLRSRFINQNHNSEEL